VWQGRQNYDGLDLHELSQGIKGMAENPMKCTHHQSHRITPHHHSLPLVGMRVP